MGLKFSSFFIGKGSAEARGGDAWGGRSADETALEKLKLRLTARIVVILKRYATLQARCGGFKGLRLIRRPLICFFVYFSRSVFRQKRIKINVFRGSSRQQRIPDEKLLWIHLRTAPEVFILVKKRTLTGMRALTRAPLLCKRALTRAAPAKKNAKLHCSVKKHVFPSKHHAFRSKNHICSSKILFFHQENMFFRQKSNLPAVLSVPEFLDPGS